MSLKSPPEDSWPFLYLLQFDLFCSHCALKVCCPLFPFMEFSSRYVMPSSLDFKSSINFILCLWITFQSPKIMSCKKVIERKMMRMTKATKNLILERHLSLCRYSFTMINKVHWWCKDSFLTFHFCPLHLWFTAVGRNDAASKTPTRTSIIAAWRERSIITLCSTYDMTVLLQSKKGSFSCMSCERSELDLQVNISNLT